MPILDGRSSTAFQVTSKWQIEIVELLRIAEYQKSGGLGQAELPV
jgi:hypothetical protein